MSESGGLKAPFYKTVEIFSGVVGKRLRLKFESYATPSTDGTTIVLPTCSPDDWRDVYTSLEHELGHIVFRSDFRNLQKFLDQHYKKYGSFLPRAVYNLVEDHRVDSLWSRIYAGSAMFMKDYASRVLSRTKVSTPLSTLMAIRYDFWHMIPENLKPLAQRLAPLIKSVEGKGPAATHVVAGRILPIIAPYYPPFNPPPQSGQGPSEREEHKEQKTGKEETSKTGASKASKTPETTEVEEAEGGEVEKAEAQKAEPQKTEAQPSEASASKPSEAPSEAKAESEGEKEAKREEAKPSVPSSWGIDAEVRKIEEEMEREVISVSNVTAFRVATKETKVDHKNPDEALKEAEEEGRRMVERVKKQLNVPIPRHSIDEGIIGTVITKDVFGHSVDPMEADHAVAKQLRSAFLRIKGKASLTEEDSGLDVDIDNYIQRKVGKDGSIPPFVAEELNIGLNIVLLLDCSGSMGTHKLGDSRRPLDSAKRVVLTLYEAIQRLPNVDLEVYAFSGNNYSDYQTPVVKLTPQRLATLSISHDNEYTHIHRAVQYVTNILARKLGKKLLIIVTDGVPQSVNLDFATMLRLTSIAVYKARRRGIEVFTIRVGEDVDESEMRIMYGPEKYWAVVPNFEQAGKVLINQVGRKVVSMLYER